MASILLVEDNDDHAILARRALSGSNQMFEVERAASVDECLAMLEEKSYDAIVLDYSLPKRSGLELLQEFEEAAYDVPVVMITSQGDEKIAVEAMKSGAYDYVSKVDDYLTKLPLTLQKAIKAHEMATERAGLQAKIEESENRLRNIFESVDVGFIEIRHDRIISYANTRAKHYLGITDEPQTVNIHSLFPQDRGDESGSVNDVIESCFGSGESANCGIEYNDKQLSVAVTPIRGNDASIEQLVIVLMDVTDQKRLQQQLVQSERIRVLGRMASGIAHDFNNILAAILGRAELMLMDPGDEEKIKKGLQVIQEAALGGADTVKRMQEFTGVAKQKESGRLKVNDVVRDAVRMTEPRWKDESQRDGINIDVSMELNSRSLIAGSAADMREALTNMVFNAVEAMPDGGTLSIRTYDDGECACISISDTGTGVPPEIADSIFEPFFTTKGVGYAGLGLSVAYGIIRRHEGEIHVDSAAGEGATFTARLTACVEEVQKDEPAATTDEPGKANILVVDDEENIRELLTNILTRFNHNVVTATCGTDGVAAFQDGNYDVVFTDLGMPEMSGWEVAQQIKDIAPNVMVVLITGWGVELDEDELRKKNIDSVISKPFQIRQILEVTSEALESSRE
ncbi:response regulator [Candidatus Poribacteria bacterium]